MRQTTYPKGSTQSRQWFMVDVKDLKLGRAASLIASMINGKTSPLYTPYANNACGVIVLNAAQIKVTGDKLEKRFYWHTGYPGGIKSRTIKERLEKDPCSVIFKAVERMIPRNCLGRMKMKNLRVFPDSLHCHQSLKPVFINIASMNSKNILGSNKYLNEKIEVNNCSTAVVENLDKVASRSKKIKETNKGDALNG